MGDWFEEIEEVYVGVDWVLGRLVKVMLMFKVVGDLVLVLVGVGVSVDEFVFDLVWFGILELVFGFLWGELGDLFGGWFELLCIVVLVGCGVVRFIV